jgi:cell wall-associated NlpC family hydrolase
VSAAPAFARAAENLAGTRFRLRGRDPATGLDCVGLVAAALATTGRDPPAPSGYGLRNSSINEALGFASGAGFDECAGEPIAGDLLLVRPGPLQHHLLIALERGRFVHAHAGLRRVTITPGPAPWPILRHWRLRS